MGGVNINGLNYDLFSTHNNHYEDQRAIARSYLVTMGSKALIAMELNEGSHNEMLERLSIEANMKIQLQADEAIRIMLEKLHSLEGIQIIKRDRRNKKRVLIIRLIRNKHGDTFIWKSKHGWWMKRFRLSNIIEIEEHVADSLRRSDRNGRIRNEVTASNHHTHNNKYIRITNNHRRIELKFHTISEHNACLAILNQLKSAAAAANNNQDNR